MARLRSSLEQDLSGGQVVVTRFECGNLAALAAVHLLHVRLKFDVRRHARGFLGVTTIVDRPRRTLLSISLWQDLDSIYSMGSVPRHVSAARLPARLGVQTTCGIFCLVGDWRQVMFQGSAVTRSPLYPLNSVNPESSSTHVRGKGG